MAPSPSTRLPFLSWRNVALTDDRAVVIEYEGEHKVHLWRYSGEIVWTRDRPGGIDEDCNTAIDERRREVLLHWKGVTVILGLDDGAEKRRVERRGHLLCCMTTSQALYRVEDEDGTWHLEVTGDDGQVAESLHSPGRKWSEYINACECNGIIAVTDNDNSTLTIFHRDSKSHNICLETFPAQISVI